MQNAAIHFINRQQLGLCLEPHCEILRRSPRVLSRKARVVWTVAVSSRRNIVIVVTDIATMAILFLELRYHRHCDNKLAVALLNNLSTVAKDSLPSYDASAAACGP